MSKIYLEKLNDVQKDFVLYDAKKNVLVSASAGTGKTTSMISKLVYLIVEKKVSLKELLVVTYTTSAANEMKQKLFRLLSQTIAGVEDLDERNRLSEELDDLNNADIGTIHSICKKLITKYFYELGIDPKFSIVTDKEQKYLLSDSIQKVFDNYIISKDKDFFRLFESYNAKRETEDLKSIIERIFTFLKSKEDPESWKRKVLAKAYDLDFNNNSCAKYMFTYYKDLFSRFEPEFKMLFNRAENLGLSKIQGFKENITGFFVQIGCATNYLEIATIINDYELSKKPTRTRNADIEESMFWDDLEVYFTKLKQIKKSVVNNLVIGKEEELKEKLKFVYKNLLKIMEVVHKTNEVYAKLKQNKKCLDFNDLEYYTLELFKNEVVLEDIKNSYKYVFIDEYQDVNGVQEKIITKISNGTNLIMIGDVKQSIYEFRLSVPQNFIDKYNDSTNNKIFDFNKNYRSEDNILQFVNSIFKTLISTKTIGLDYTNSNLVCGKDITKEKCVNMDIVNLDKDEDDETTTDKEMQYEVQANLVVEKINELIKKVNQKFKSKDYEFNDIAILTRKKGESVRYLYNKLQENNIPVSVELKNNLFDNSEVIFLISFLKLLNNYEDDIALASVLKNPIFGFDENEFVEIRLFSDNKFWKNCLNYNIGDLGSKLKNFWNTINEYKEYLNNHKIVETLEKFILDKGILTFYKTLPDGLEKESNINEFLLFSSNESYSYSLSRFLDYISGVAGNNHVLKVKANENCVKIITMHSSKGLDYKAVIVYDFSSEFNLNAREKDLFICDKLGIGLRYFDLKNRIGAKSLPMLACKTLSAKNQIDEEIRLFYVALTRAKQELYLVGSYKLDKILQKQNEPVYSCKSFIELLFYSLDNCDLYKFSNKIPEFYINEGENGECKVRIITPIVQKVEKKTSPIMFTGIDEDVVKDLLNYYCYVYPNKISSEVAVKNSVTSIMQEEVDYEKMVDSLSDLNIYSTSNVENNALKIGTAYHKIMENLTYKETFEEVVNLIKNLEINGDLDKKYSNYINPNKIFKAVETIQSLNPINIKKESQFLLNIPYKNVVENSNIENKVLIQGVVDLIVETKEGFLIIDFKTNRNCSEEFLINHYALQLDIYKKAVEKALNVKVKSKYIYSFELAKLIEIL